MNLIVLIKQTFDTEEKIVVDGLNVSEENAEFIINPYDEYAIEEAIRLRDQYGGEVTVITIGPERSEQALRTALAMGADKGIQIVDDTLFADEYVLSRMLAEVISPREYDLILAGNFAIDSGSGQVAIRLAEVLDLPHIGSVVSLRIEDAHIAAGRDAEGDTEEVRAPLPALITAQQGLNEPRYPSLPGIMKAKNKPLERLSVSDIPLGEATVAKTSATALFLPPGKKDGMILQGSIEQQVKQLADLLRHENKVV